MTTKTVSRPTQSFVQTLSLLKEHPSWTVLEIGWRWLFGIPALLLCWHYGQQIMNTTPWQQTGIAGLTVNKLLTDPMSASVVLANAISVLLPPVVAVGKWLGPLLILVWSVAAGLGRTLLLKRMLKGSHARPFTVIVLNLLRVIPLAASVLLWWWLLSVAARHFILDPLTHGGENGIMSYVGTALVLTIGLIAVWAAVSWIFFAAPLLAVRDNKGVLASLRAAAGLNQMRAGMVEINLVLAVVRLMLLVVFLAFSACPLPFSSTLSMDFMVKWSLAMFVGYCAAQDFFHVARMGGYLQLWKQGVVSCF